MNTTQRYQLIAGDFAPDQAMQILLSLVTSKIDFHNLEMLSNEERFGRDLAQSAVRLAQLRQLHETLRAACQSAGKAGTRLQVNGWIEIQPAAPADAGKHAVPAQARKAEQSAQ